MSFSEHTPGAYKALRSELEPVDPEHYHELYSAAASFLFRSQISLRFFSPNTIGLLSERRTPNDTLQEQVATGWINGNRLVGVSFYPMNSKKQSLYGIEADVATAPAPGKINDTPFELSTDGTKYWVAKMGLERSITPQELRTLVYDLGVTAGSAKPAE